MYVKKKTCGVVSKIPGWYKKLMGLLPLIYSCTYEEQKTLSSLQK
jgi:hypothetical protein